MSAYATITDMANLWRPLTDSEKPRAEALLELVADCLRVEANKVNKDLDAMIEAQPSLLGVAKSVSVDVAARELMTPTTSSMAPMSQFSEAALGYSISGTYLVPGGGLFIKKSELARLGLKRQQIRVIDMMGESDD